MGCDWDAFQKHYQNRVQKVINPRLYERDMFSAEKSRARQGQLDSNKLILKPTGLKRAEKLQSSGL